MVSFYRTKAFIIKKKDFGDADRMFTVFSKEFGKILVTGRSIRKIKSKLKSGMDNFYLSEIEFFERRGRRTLTDSKKICNFPEIRKSLEKTEIANKISNLIVEFIGNEEKDEKIWLLIREVFLNLNQISEKKCFILYYYFFWNFLSILGYDIDFYKCSFCSQKIIPPDVYFIPETKGIADKKCFFENKKRGYLVSLNAIKILRLFLRRDMKTLSRVKIDLSCAEVIKKMSQDYKNQFVNY